MRKMQKLFEEKFTVEHALNMFAEDYCVLPAKELYNDAAIAAIADVASNCHIYMIGLVPNVDLKNIKQEERKLIYSLHLLGRLHEVSVELPVGLNLCREDGYWFCLSADGKKYMLSNESVMCEFGRQVEGLKFDVQYIGQAYGSDGSRNALHRLRKHETLQKISLKGIPEGYRLELLLLSVQPDNRIITVFNPHAEEDSDSRERISQGVDKLFDTDERERITLFEAAFIRYFRPPYNIEFKDSFPSTRMKVLADCYAKDFAGVTAEICIDALIYQLCSNDIDPKDYHIVSHDLNKDENRRFFFFGLD